MPSLAEKDRPMQQWCLEKLFTVFVGTFRVPLLRYFIVVMTLKTYIFPVNSIPSYFNGSLSFVVFLIVEGSLNVNIFCGH